MEPLKVIRVVCIPTVLTMTIVRVIVRVRKGYYVVRVRNRSK